MSIPGDTPGAGPTITRTDVQVWGQDVQPNVVEAVVGLIDTLLTVWRAPDRDARMRILERCAAPSITYANPLARVVGVEAVSAHIGEIGARFPGHHPVRTSGIDIHHNYARFEWAMQDRAGRRVLYGVDIHTFDATPAIASVVSFFGPPPRITYSYSVTQ